MHGLWFATEESAIDGFCLSAQSSGCSCGRFDAACPLASANFKNLQVLPKNVTKGSADRADECAGGGDRQRLYALPRSERSVGRNADERKTRDMMRMVGAQHQVAGDDESHHLLDVPPRQSQTTRQARGSLTFTARTLRWFWRGRSLGIRRTDRLIPNKLR